ncbi:MAG: endonuclease/exonuclease/phosphatase family protein [Actinomycetia bacterium]|nr:endonuclease/exonuclease/phosphatase family protein [Actinomycetes bacterium]
MHLNRLGALRRAGLVAALAGALALAAPGVAGATGGHHAPPALKVMSQNLYLGSSLEPALVATTPEEFVVGVTTIWQTAQFTNFPARAKAIAATIDRADPDLVGLQEVSRWTPVGPGAPAGLDFLAILQAELAARGLHYTVAAVSENANIGPAPLICDFTTGALCTYALQFQDRDVILVNRHTRGLAWWGAASGRYVNQQLLPSPVGTLSFDRGWASIEAKYWGQRFRFVNTHLETEDYPAVQEAQAMEFLAGPAKSRGRVIATGDFNSAADGSTTASYRALTSKFRDAWWVNGARKGYTCCQNGTLTNTTSELRSRIDLVLTRGARTQSAWVVGARPFQAVPPFWPSDHAGVVAVMKLV